MKEEINSLSARKAGGERRVRRGSLEKRGTMRQSDRESAATQAADAFIDLGGTYLRIEWRTRGRTHKSRVSAPETPARVVQIAAKALKGRRPGRLVAGLRGVWSPRERTAWRRRLAPLASTVMVMSDLEAHLYRAFGTGPGAVLNAGTGSMALARLPNGRFVRAGGLGPLIGDEGSAFWIGKRYAGHLATNGRKENKVRELAKGTDSVSKISGLAAVVRRRARADRQGVESRILREAEDHLIALLGRLRERLPGRVRLPIALTGAVLADAAFRERIMRRAKRLGFEESEQNH